MKYRYVVLWDNKEILSGVIDAKDKHDARRKVFDIVESKLEIDENALVYWRIKGSREWLNLDLYVGDMEDVIRLGILENIEIQIMEL